MTVATIQSGGWSSVEPELARLRVFHATVSGLNALGFVVAEVRSANNASLRQALTLIDRLSFSGDLGRQLNDGTITVAKWAQIANSAGDTINRVLQTLGEENIAGRAWNDIVVPTVTTVRTAVTEYAGGVGVGFGAVLALVLVVFVLRR